MVCNCNDCMFLDRKMSELENRKTSERSENRPAKSCIHCGDPCGKGSIQSGDHYFCCPGCLTVYNLLNENSLDDYYSIEDKPGLRPDRINTVERFAYLDKKEIREKLLDYSDDKIAKVTFSIPQIHCSSCIWLLENLYKLNPAVQSSRVNFQKRIVSVTFNINELSLKDLVFVLASIGYEPEINLSSVGEKKKDISFRTLYARLAVAGFCFGNVMLLSFPEYLGFDAEVEASYGFIFSITKILLSLPVLFFSASDFFISAYKSIKQKHINMDVPVSLGIIILFLRSLYEVAVLNQAGYFDSMCALVFLLLIGRLYQKKTYFSLAFGRDYRSYLPISVTSKNENGTETSISLDELNKGMRIIIRNYEIIPADSVFIKGQGKIDYSFVTGESNPVTISSGDKVYAGGRQMGQSIELEIIKKPSRSYLMQLWAQTEQVIEAQPGLTSLANRLAFYFTPTILILAFITGIYWLIFDSSKAMNAATAVLIIACPCALALASPFTLGTIQRIMGKSKLFLKDDTVVEKMSHLNAMVFDKTGTITQSGASTPVFVGAELTDEQKSMIYSLVRQSTHSLSVLITDILSNSKIYTVKNYDELRGRGLEADVNGYHVKIGSYKWMEIKNKDKLETTSVFVSIDNEILGYYRIANLFRKGMTQVITDLRKNYAISLLSGDNDSEKERVAEMFGADAELLFNRSPHDKLSYINTQVNNGQQVAMIGDGLNDAGALKAATVGITVAENASSFSPACDGILMASEFRHLSQFFKLSSDGIKIIKVSFIISLLYNIIGLVFAVQGTLSPVIAAILMPASSVTVVLLTTVASFLSARRRGLI